VILFPRHRFDRRIFGVFVGARRGVDQDLVFFLRGKFFLNARRGEDRGCLLFVVFKYGYLAGLAAQPANGFLRGDGTGIQSEDAVVHIGRPAVVADLVFQDLRRLEEHLQLLSPLLDPGCPPEVDLHDSLVVVPGVE
jgi:hypothetical protein